jgi:hypothetical protein
MNNGEKMINVVVPLREFFPSRLWTHVVLMTSSKKRKKDLDKILHANPCSDAEGWCKIWYNYSPYFSQSFG